MTEYTSYHRGVTSTDGNQYIRFYLGSGIKLRSSAEPFLRRQDVLNKSHMTAITSVPGLLHSLGTSLHQQHLFSRFLSNNFFLKRSSGFPAVISQFILFLFTEPASTKGFFLLGASHFLVGLSQKQVLAQGLKSEVLTWGTTPGKTLGCGKWDEREKETNAGEASHASEAQVRTRL